MIIAASMISLAGILALLSSPPHEAVAVLLTALAIFFNAVWHDKQKPKYQRE